MKKILEIDKKKLFLIKEEFGFYNFENQTSIKNNTLKLYQNEEEVVQYSDLAFGGDLGCYESQVDNLINFIIKFIKKVDCEACILSKYSYKWILNKDMPMEINKLLEKCQLKNTFQGGLEVDTNELEYFLNSIFMYNSFINIILPYKDIIITPSDHMDIFISAKDIVLVENVIASLGHDFNIIKF